MNIIDFLEQEKDIDLDEASAYDPRAARQAGRQVRKDLRQSGYTQIMKQIKNIDAKIARAQAGSPRHQKLLGQRQALVAQAGAAQGQVQNPQAQAQMTSPAAVPQQPAQQPAQQPVQQQAPLSPQMAQRLDMGITDIKNRASQGDQQAIGFLKKMAAQVSTVSNV